MLCKRIIPCLDCDLAYPEGRVVKGIEFKQIRYAGIPWVLAEKYYRDGADEIVFLDITASHERRETMVRVVEKTAENVFIPITVGGGIKSLKDARRVFKAGADKVSINTAAVQNPDLINEASDRFGSQCIVVAIDPKSVGGKYIVHTHGGRRPTGLEAVSWAKEVVRRGAGDRSLAPHLLTGMERLMCRTAGDPLASAGHLRRRT